MEAERLNALAALITDLRNRVLELVKDASRLAI